MVDVTRKLWKEAKLRLAKRDASVQRRFLKTERAYHHLATVFEFQVGQLVLQRAKRLGKIRQRATGPYTITAIAG